MRTARARLQQPDAFVRTMYGLLGEHADFRNVLPLIADRFDAHIVALHEEDLFAGSGRAELHGSIGASELVALGHEYAQRWAGENLLIQRCAEGLLRQGFQSPDEVISASELLASPYYQHYLRRVDVRHGVGIALMRHGDQRLSMLAVNRSSRAGALRPEEAAFVKAVQPHLAGAYALSRRLRTLESENLSLRAGIERLSFGVVSLNTRGRVLFANGAAHVLFGARRGMRLDAQHRLRLSRSDQQTRLDQVLNRFASVSAPVAPEVVVIGSAEGGNLLVMCLHAAPAQTGPAYGAEPHVIGFVHDLDSIGEERLALRVLQRAMGLTPTEARIALAMRAHHDPERVAAVLKLSPATVRTHLKHAFRKAGVSKQTELTRLVDRIAGLVPHAALDCPGADHLPSPDPSK